MILAEPTTPVRDGNFSSSEIWKLTKSGRSKNDLFGAPALTYIEEKKYEIALGRPLSKEHDARPTNWGKLCEPLAFDRMGIEYQLVSKVRYVHPTIEHWTGMPDVVTHNLSGDIKCPWTLKPFCQMADAMKEGPEALKECKPEYYWQLISNCILTKKKKAGLFIFVPYKEELEEVREAAAAYDGEENMDFVNWMSDEDLPYLIKGAKYKNLNELIFEVPKEDIEFLEYRVSEAVKLLA